MLKSKGNSVFKWWSWKIWQKWTPNITPKHLLHLIRCNRFSQTYATNQHKKWPKKKYRLQRSNESKKKSGKKHKCAQALTSSTSWCERISWFEYVNFRSNTSLTRGKKKKCFSANVRKSRHNFVSLYTHSIENGTIFRFACFSFCTYDSLFWFDFVFFFFPFFSFLVRANFLTLRARLSKFAYYSELQG